MKCPNCGTEIDVSKLIEAGQKEALQKQTEEFETKMAEAKREQVAEANRQELELRKQQQTLEDEKAALELTVQRKLDSERKTIQEAASKRATEETHSVPPAQQDGRRWLDHLHGRTGGKPPTATGLRHHSERRSSVPTASARQPG